MNAKTFKRLIAKVGIAALLFTRLVVAAYACPTLAVAVESAPAVMAAMPAGMPDCEEFDAGNANLCSQHCQAGDQSVQTPNAPVPEVAAIVPLTILEPVQLGYDPVAVVSALLERATSPPPLVRFRVLRI